MIKPFDEENRRAFMNLFPHTDRPAISKFFFDLVRSIPKSSVTIEVIQAGVEKKWKRLTHGFDKEATRKMRGLRDTLLNPETHHILLGYIDFLYDWEKLTPDEKSKYKAKRGLPHAHERMAKLPPSDKQLSYLINMGYRGEIPVNRDQASQLISAMTQKQKLEDY